LFTETSSSLFHLLMLARFICLFGLVVSNLVLITPAAYTALEPRDQSDSKSSTCSAMDASKPATGKDCGTSGAAFLQNRQQLSQHILDESNEWNNDDAWNNDADEEDILFNEEDHFDEDNTDTDADEEEDALWSEEDDFDKDGEVLSEGMEERDTEMHFDLDESLVDASRAGLKLHVRPAPVGSDITGDGTIKKPYATVKEAVSKKKGAIEGANSPTYIYVSGTFFPPDIRSTNPHGGDTTITVAAPNKAPLIITPHQGSTALF